MFRGRSKPVETFQQTTTNKQHASHSAFYRTDFRSCKNSSFHIKLIKTKEFKGL